MTNAPFTSETASGIPKSKAPLVVFAIGAALLAVGGAVGVIKYLKPSGTVASHVSTATSGAPSPIAALSASSAPVAKDTPLEHDRTADAGVDTPAASKPAVAKTPTTPAVAAPKTPAKALPATPATPATPVTPTKTVIKPPEEPHPPVVPAGKPPTKKKANADDSGY